VRVGVVVLEVVVVIGGVVTVTGDVVGERGLWPTNALLLALRGGDMFTRVLCTSIE